MRIRELLEGKNFNDLDFVNVTENGRELNFDLAEDLFHYMNNDDHIYRRSVYPKVAVFLEKHNKKQPAKASIFGPAVKECYKSYINKFPIRELPEEIDEDIYKQVCRKFSEEIKKHLEETKDKD
jgi:hypothetical protein